ncbi:histone methylation protein DOT1-domain-containing protein [Trichophaea hybrida]|nr:histone methylation protein DOT1-domain-containing protein [Trichophaea hybrida]
MSTSFFKKFTPAGSTPIVAQKRVVKTSSTSTIAPDDHRNKKLSRARHPTSHQQHPRRVASVVTLAVTTTTTTKKLPPATATTPLKRSFEPSRSVSTPNLKRPAPSRDSLKPPSLESLPRHHHRSAASSRSPRSLRLESSSEEDSDDERSSKRSKMGSASPGAVVDTSRRIVHPVSFRTKDPKTGLPLERCNFIHAHEIASVKLEGWSRRREFRNTDGNLTIGLHYPGVPDQERFQLVQNSDPDEFDPLAEILTTMEMVADHLLPRSIADKIHSETSGGIVYRMRRSLKHGDAPRFLENLKTYNELVRESRKNTTFRKRIAGMTTIPFALVEHILQQSYARTVALEVEGLKDYQAFSSEVYGELLPKFTTKIFKEANLTSDKVFMDLGSGTGNVVLHAALECGCESWGCEKMDKPALLAERQRKEFIARCRMWGINHGAVYLQHDTFLENRSIAETLKRADVLLVNNFAFEPDLNQKLLDMFLDLKEGAQIFSLKPFVPANHVITTRNAENPVNRLRMVEREYFSREVSWTDSGGKYYVHTVDSSMLREFMEKEMREKKRRAQSAS